MLNLLPYTLRVSRVKVGSENGEVRRDYVTISQEFFGGDSRDLPWVKSIEIEKTDIQKIIDSLERIKNEE